MNERSAIKEDRQELKKALEELHLHQTELEMQNDELRIANERLEVQQLKFSGIYDMAPIGYYILEKSGLIHDVNHIGVALLETGKASVINSRLQNFMSPDYADLYHLFFREIITNGQKQTREFKMISKKGREFYVQMEGIAINPIRNLPLQVDITVMDITSRVLAEKALSSTKERLELALAASSSGTWELEPKTMNFDLDESSFQNFPFLQGKLHGKFKSFLTFIHPDDRLGAEQQFHLAVSDKQPIDVTCRLEGSEQVCIANLLGHMVSDAGQPDRFVGIIMDVTKKKKLEEEAVRNIQQQRRNIALATIRAEENERTRISNALHDSVSQLLYGVRIKLNTVLDNKNPTTAMHEVYELLDMAVQETRNVSFELAPAILSDFGLRATVEEMSRRLSSPKLIIKTKLTRLNQRMSLPFEANIFRIIQELVNNALRHSEASLITVEVRKNKSVEITVSDNGRGFHIAQSGDSVTGSGLTSIKNRIQLYNGSLAIESKAGAGTVVKIKLEINL